MLKILNNKNKGKKILYMKTVYYVLKGFIDDRGKPILNSKELVGAIEEKDLIDEVEEVIDAIENTNNKRNAESNTRVFCDTNFFSLTETMSFPAIGSNQKWDIN